MITTKEAKEFNKMVDEIKPIIKTESEKLQDEVEPITNYTTKEDRGTADLERTIDELRTKLSHMFTVNRSQEEILAQKHKEVLDLQKDNKLLAKQIDDFIHRT